MNGNTENKAAWMREYRQKIKQDNPEFYHARKEYEAVMMKIRRANWTEEQAKMNRQQSKIRMKKYRDRKKAEKSGRPCTRQEEEKQQVLREKWKLQKRRQRANMSAQKMRRVREKDRETKRKKAASLMSKRNITKEFQAVNSTPSSSVGGCSVISKDAIRKATYRIKKKLPKSPRKCVAVISALAKASGIAIRTTRDKEMMDTLKKTYKSLAGRKKDQLKLRRTYINKLAVNIKRRNMSAICNRLGINRKFMTRNRMDKQKTKRRKDAIDENVKKSVEEFFKQEYVSTNIPNVKLIKNKFESKYILQNTYRESYKKWKEQHPTVKLSFSKFIEIKPKNVLKQSRGNLLQCLCEYCENVRLKFAAVNNCAVKLDAPQMRITDKYTAVNLILCEKEDQFHKLACVNRTCETCSSKVVRDKLEPLLNLGEFTWQSWDYKKHENQKTGNVSSRRELVSKSNKPDEFIEQFVTELEFLAKHLFQAHWQQVQFSSLSKSVGENEIMITADFAQNFTVFRQNEIQGAHWQRDQITIHPTIVNYLCPEDHEVIEEAIDIVTDDLVHDSHAFAKFHKDIYEFLIKERNLKISEEIIVTDGAASQYKCKTAFMDASLGCGTSKIQRHYYGSRHCKNRCDGEGGILKSKVSAGIKSGVVTIYDAHSFYVFCKDTLTKPAKLNGECNHKRRTILYVSQNDIVHDRDFPQGLKTLKGSRNIHSLCGIAPGIVATRKLSCFCKNCREKNYHQCLNNKWVDPWEIHNITNNTPKVANEAPQTIAEFSRAGTSTGEAYTDNAQKVGSEASAHAEIPLEGARSADDICTESLHPVDVGQWVAAIYDDQWYPGVVEKVLGDHVQVSFMEQKGSKSFLWPFTQDLQLLKTETLLCEMQPPISVSYKLFQFSKETVSKVTNIFNHVMSD